MNKISFISEEKELTLEREGIYLFEKLIDSKVNINIKSNVKLIFLHDDKNSNSKVQINLVSDNANAIVREIVVTSDEQNFCKTVDIFHLAKKTKSDYVFFGFAKNKSNLKISVKSRILKGNSQSEAHQIIRILTTDSAQATGEPGLLIDDFDVKASHGNSIGQVSERDLYYLQTKGVDKECAKWMILEGKIKESLNGLDDSIRLPLIKYFKERIDHE